MAMSDTGSSFAQWAGIYPYDPLPALPTDDDLVVAAAAAASPTSGGSSGSPTTTTAKAAAGQQHQQQLLHGVEGPRAGKPARRRSRASRRAPVTLLNTDTSNFRAMVQQFTGIPAVPAGPYGGPGGGGGPVISFGGAGGGGGEYGALVRPSPTSAVMSFDHHMGAAARGPAPSSLQGHHHQQQQLFRPQHHHQYGGDVGGGYSGGLHGDMSSSPFFHGFDPSAEDRMLLQSMQAAQMMPSRPASTANNGNGYNFG